MTTDGVHTPLSLAMPNYALRKTRQHTQNIENVPIVPVVNNVIETRAKTPLVTPRFGIAKTPGTNKSPATIYNTSKYVDVDFETTLKPGENPWLPHKINGFVDIKITGLTPIGTIAMVPTLDKRPPPTPRRYIAPTPGRNLTLRVMDLDPILNATIMLDLTKSDYHHVANRMRSITENTINLQKQYTNELQPLLNISGHVSRKRFEEALGIYENNQVYYQDRMDDKKLDINTIKRSLTELERWFLNIIEPKPIDDVESWKEREEFKLTKGISSYCDPELHQHIQLSPH